jgi:hypothetical protein
MIQSGKATTRTSGSPKQQQPDDKQKQQREKEKQKQVEDEEKKPKDNKQQQGQNSRQNNRSQQSAQALHGKGQGFHQRNSSTTLGINTIFTGSICRTVADSSMVVIGSRLLKFGLQIGPATTIAILKKMRATTTR